MVSEDDQSSVTSDMRRLHKFERPLHKFPIASALRGIDVSKAIIYVRKTKTCAEREQHAFAKNLGEHLEKLTSCQELQLPTLLEISWSQVVTHVGVLVKEVFPKELKATLVFRYATESCPPRTPVWNYPPFVSSSRSSRCDHRIRQ